jgi:drug/metabolite transporter (DMT)-like permease
MLIVAVSLGGAGQLCLKYGVKQLGENVPAAEVLKGIFTPYVFTGFVLYGLSSLLYLVVLSRLSLSFAYPFVAITFAMVILLSPRLLGETLPALRILGCVIIILGVFTVAASYGTETKPAANAPPAIEQSR